MQNVFKIQYIFERKLIVDMKVISEMKLFYVSLMEANCLKNLFIDISNPKWYLQMHYMTINNAYGQTIVNICIYLSELVFLYDQL